MPDDVTPGAWVTDDPVTGVRGGLVVAGRGLPDDTLAAALAELAGLDDDPPQA